MSYQFFNGFADRVGSVCVCVGKATHVQTPIRTTALTHTSHNRATYKRVRFPADSWNNFGRDVFTQPSVAFYTKCTPVHQYWWFFLFFFCNSQQLVRNTPSIYGMCPQGNLVGCFVPVEIKGGRSNPSVTSQRRQPRTSEEQSCSAVQRRAASLNTRRDRMHEPTARFSARPSRSATSSSAWHQPPSTNSNCPLNASLLTICCVARSCSSHLTKQNSKRKGTTLDKQRRTAVATTRCSS